MKKVTGKTIVLTGANSGIGLETLKLLAAEDNKILAVDLRTDKIEEFDKEKVIPFVCDVSKKENVDAIFDKAIEVLGSIDIFFANDFIITSHLVAAEIAGYLPYGEGWKYICEGRTAYDGDKPINTNGGRTSFGHAHAASGLADLYEAVHQMRGEAGEGQVKKLPKTAMLRGYGGAQNICTYIIRTID